MWREGAPRSPGRPDAAPAHELHLSPERAEDSNDVRVQNNPSTKATAMRAYDFSSEWTKAITDPAFQNATK